MYTPLEIIGLISLCILGFLIARRIIRLLYNNVIGRLMRTNVNLKEMGRWAVVTGATDGIGKAYAEANQNTTSVQKSLKQTSLMILMKHTIP